MKEDNIPEKPNPWIVTTDRPVTEVLRDFFNAAQTDEAEKDSERPMDLPEAEKALKDNEKKINIYRGRIISIDFSNSDENSTTIDVGVYAAFNGKGAVEAALMSLQENYWEEL